MPATHHDLVIRNARLLDGIGPDVVVHSGCVIEDRRTRFGDDIWLSVGCYIDYAIIEDHVLIGQHAVLLAGKGHHNSACGGFSQQRDGRAG